MQNLTTRLSLVAAAVVIAGCATIVGSPTQVVPIASTPDGATIEITDEKGSKIFTGTTPTSVTLNKSDGSYFGGKQYKVRIAKDGFKPTEVTVNSNVNGWYIGGNILFGGLIGWLIVDPLNGGMYTLSPENVAATLEAGKAAAAPGAIRVVLVSELTPSQMEKMVKVN